MIEKIKHIIIGNFYRLIGKKQDLFEERYSICKRCKELTPDDYIGDYCGLCGCPISSKARVQEEHCELNKW